MKHTKAFLLLALSVLIFSCSGEKSGYGPIFYNICQEVALEEPVVTGNIYSIVEGQIGSADYLFAANGRLWKKEALAERGWVECTLPDDVNDDIGFNKIIRLATTDGYLYAFTAYKKVYYTKLEETFNWVDISDSLATVSTSANYTCTIFDNDAPCDGTGVRRAFYSNSSTNAVYELKDGVAQTTALSVTVAPNIGYNGYYTSSSTSVPATPIKAAYISTNNTTIFSADVLLTSNRTTTFYHAANDRIDYSTDGATWNSVTPDIAVPYSLAYYTDGSNGWLYLGNKTGIEAININTNAGSDGVPTTTVSSAVGSNITSCLGDMLVMGIYPYPMGSKNVYAAAVVYFSTTAASNKNKLWGYYPTRADGNDDTWNCE